MESIEGGSVFPVDGGGPCGGSEGGAAGGGEEAEQGGSRDDGGEARQPARDHRPAAALGRAGREPASVVALGERSAQHGS